jgi:gluconate 5-dehydrogenase
MSLDLFSLAGRTALVTGSSMGIGFTLARGLGRAGATVVINARREDRLAAAAAELRAAGLTVHALPFDVTDNAAVEAAVARIEDEVGPIDILVNNAGMQLRKPVAEWSPEEWHRIIDTNLTSAWFMSRAVGMRMLARGEGKVIFICSAQSELGRRTIVPYTASKGGLRMMVRGLCAEWAGSGIQVNGVGPGYFATELTSALVADQDFDTWLRGRIPAARWGDPEELVGACVFLASPASSYVNGQVVYVDGGLLAAI